MRTTSWFLKIERSPSHHALSSRVIAAVGTYTVNGAFYRTGDVAARSTDGYFTYIGRADDVFKASDYRISPFELESALIEHPAVAEAAVVPAPDPIRLAVPKAYIMLTTSASPDRATALSIFQHLREVLLSARRALFGRMKDEG